MLPKTHIIMGGIASIILFLLFPHFFTLFYAFIVFLSSVLIDFDHYIYYAVKKKDLSLAKAYKWFVSKSDIWKNLSQNERKEYKKDILIFHGFECWLLLILLIYISPLFLFILIGIFIHMLFDFIDLYIHRYSPGHKVSQIYTHIRNKKKKELG